jgi:hypothetical protein
MSDGNQTDILQQLDEIGDWVSDKEWHQHPIAAEAQREIKRLRANHRDVVEHKRGTSKRLKAALEGLQQIYDVCRDNVAESCNHRMALDFVHQVAGAAFEKATRNLPPSEWKTP